MNIIEVIRASVTQIATSGFDAVMMLFAIVGVIGLYRVVVKMLKLN